MGRSGYHDGLTEVPVRDGTLAIVSRTGPAQRDIRAAYWQARGEIEYLEAKRRAMLAIYQEQMEWFRGQIAAMDAELARLRAGARDAWADQAEGQGR